MFGVLSMRVESKSLVFGDAADRPKASTVEIIR